MVGRSLASPERQRSLFGRPNPASRRRAACGGNGLARGPQGGVCKKVTPKLLGGLPSEVPDHYDQTSPIELLPIGVPIRSIIGDQDGPVLIDMVKRYDEKARAAGDDSKLSIVEGAGHFELTTPGSFAWGLVKETVLSLLEPK